MLHVTANSAHEAIEAAHIAAKDFGLLKSIDVTPIDGAPNTWSVKLRFAVPSRPIPVSERLPECQDDQAAIVLCYWPDMKGGWTIGGYYEGEWRNSFDLQDHGPPTHWLPLPPKPQDE